MPDETPVGEATLETSTDAPASEELTPVAPEEPAPAKKTARKTTAKKTAVKKATTKRAATKKVAASQPPADPADQTPAESAEQAPGEAADAAATQPAPAKKAAARKSAAKKTTTRKTTAKKAAVTEAPAEEPSAGGTPVEEPAAVTTPAAPPTTLVFQAPETTTTVTRRTRKTTTARTRPAATEEPAEEPTASGESAEKTPAEPAAQEQDEQAASSEAAAEERPARQGGRGGNRAGSGRRRPAQGEGEDADTSAAAGDQQAEEPADQREAQEDSHDTDSEESEGGGGRRRRRRGGRRRRKSGDGDSGGDDHEAENGSGNGSGNSSGGNGRGSGQQDSDQADSDQDDTGEGTSRRRRRRRRSGEDGEGGDDADNTVTRVRRPRSAEDEITAISGSTRLEAKKQRRRDGREAGRRRAPIVSEAEFLARRESVDRVMVIRQRDELTQIGVLEDKVLVEHYVARESQTSLIGNVYLGRVQNVLPSMEAAFIDIGKGRNAVLYAGEVNWSALGHREGQPRKIESVLSSGQSVLVQVTKDPIGHKGARLTSQISLAGRFLVYVPDGTTSGISRKLPDTERNRLKTLLKEIVPDTAGVIVRTAAEGASEDELTRDVERLKARWEDIEAKSKGSAPQLLYGEPDLTLKVVRDLFTEDFARLVIEGDDAWDTVQGYVAHVAPDLEERLERYVPAEHNGKDIFATYRVEEQIAKGLDRKVWLPSGGSLVIDRTEAMTVVDVNTGKFTGSGGNLEETVTKNNLEAAEEIVRQLRLRDIGGIIVVDFIDMVLESNRDLVLRRLVECLGRDRTRHQVAEVTSLGLVQMTRKRIGTGLVESFSENCTHCQGRGVVIHDAPVEPSQGEDDSRRGGGRRTRGGRGRSENDGAGNGSGGAKSAPSPKDVAAVAKPENAERSAETEKPAAEVPAAEAPAAEESAAPAAPQVVTRTRRRAGGRAQQAPAEPVEVQPVEVPVAAPVEVPEVEEEAPAAVAPGVPEVEEEAAAPAAPQVVTRTRRRAGGRAQQAPAEPVEVQPVEVPVAAPVEVPEVEEEAPAAVAPGVPEVEEEAAAPAAPQVVTRTRRRAASRPAGPPAPATGDTVPAMAPVADRAVTSGGIGSVPEHGALEPGTASAEPGPGDAGAADGHPAEHVEHVPIKKKGSRKR